MHQSPPATPPQRSIKPSRWIFRAVLAVLFTALGIFGYRVYRFYAAVAAVEQYGGEVIRGLGPQWLDDLEMDSKKAKLFLSEYLIVNFSYRSITDHELQQLVPHLQQFDNLYWLFLSGTNVSDEGLSYLAEFNHLSYLDISGTDISDDGLQNLILLANLDGLSLSDCNITDEGIRHLQSLKKLESLNLDGTDITDEGLKHLRSLKNLKHLSLSNTGVTDEGCAELVKAIPGLEILDD